MHPALRTLVIRLLALSIAPLLTIAAPDNTAWTEVIENREFTSGLVLKGKSKVLIRNCRISNRDGLQGILLEDCHDIRIEGSTISGVGNETIKHSDQREVQGYPYYSATLDRAASVRLENSRNVTIVRNTITDSVSSGISVWADSWQQTGNIVIEANRIAYIGDDGIHFGIRADSKRLGNAYLPIKDVTIRRNLIHNVALGLNRLGFARHGIYLTARDAIVEENTVYNVFYGEGISIRNSAVVRRNKVWNCARAAIAYWAQTNTDGSTGVLEITGNTLSQDFSLSIPMRHIGDPSKLHQLPLGVLVISMASNPHAKLHTIIVRDNTLEMGPDYALPTPVLGGNGDPAANHARWEVTGNTLIDRRPSPLFYENLPSRVDLSGNETRTTL